MPLRSFKQKGFSLLELLITLTIIGVLATFIYPSYQAFVAKSKRSHAHAALFDISLQLENYFLHNNSYEGATLDNLGIPASTPEGGYYLLALETDSPTQYQITATASESQKESDQACVVFALNEMSHKQSWGMSDGGMPEPSTGCW